MFICHSTEDLAKENRPGFNVLFSKTDGADLEFDTLTMHYRMANIPDFAVSWCKAWCVSQQPLRQFAQVFWHEDAVHVRHSLLIASKFLTDDILQKNFWAFEDVLQQFDFDIEKVNQR